MSKVTQQVSEPKLKIHLSDSRAPSTRHIIVMSCVEAPMQTTRLLFDNKSNSAQQPIRRCSEHTAWPPESPGPHPTPLRGSQRPKLTGVCLRPPFLQDRSHLDPTSPHCGDHRDRNSQAYASGHPSCRTGHLGALGREGAMESGPLPHHKC